MKKSLLLLGTGIFLTALFSACGDNGSSTDVVDSSSSVADDNGYSSSSVWAWDTLPAALQYMADSLPEMNPTTPPCKTDSTDTCEYGSLTDDRDGQTYKTVKIGDQVWMAQNLNFETGNSVCFEDADSNCVEYGRFYTWAEAMDSAAVFSTNGEGCGHEHECSPTYPVQGICPEGWHLPTRDEWWILLRAVVDTSFRGNQLDTAGSMAGMVLKSTSGWNASEYGGWYIPCNDSIFCFVPSGNGTDEYGFTALPVSKQSLLGEWEYGDYASFWSSSESDEIPGCAGVMGLTGAYFKASLFDSRMDNRKSIRCLKD